MNAQGGGAARAQGAELRVLSAGALRAVVEPLAQRFSAQTGQRVAVVVGTAGELRQLAAAEPADLVIVTAAVIGELIQAGVLAGETQLELARVGVGVAARLGGAAPDVSSSDALRRTLLAARALAYADPANGATAGIHMAAVLERLGIADRIRAKTVLRASGAAACAAVADGDAELVATQISEIVAEPRVRLLGPLPSELQRVTVYAGALTTRSRELAAARSFLAQLANTAHGEQSAAGLDYHK